MATKNFSLLIEQKMFCSHGLEKTSCLFKAMATKHFLFNEQRKIFCSHGIEKTSMDANEAATACYELTMLEIHCTQLL